MRNVVTVENDQHDARDLLAAVQVVQQGPFCQWDLPQFVIDGRGKLGLDPWRRRLAGGNQERGEDVDFSLVWKIDVAVGEGGI
jgi:hypothetical protein